MAETFVIIFDMGSLDTLPLLSFPVPLPPRRSPLTEPSSLTPLFHLITSCRLILLLLLPFSLTHLFIFPLSVTFLFPCFTFLLSLAAFRIRFFYLFFIISSSVPLFLSLSLFLSPFSFSCLNFSSHSFLVPSLSRFPSLLLSVPPIPPSFPSSQIMIYDKLRFCLIFIFASQLFYFPKWQFCFGGVREGRKEKSGKETGQIGVHREDGGRRWRSRKFCSK